MTASSLDSALEKQLTDHPRTWLVTGAAGFIGSNLVEHLLRTNQRVVGLDNFATGYQRNLDEVQALVGDAAWARFAFIEGDIRDVETCERAVAGVDVVLHHAALGSVPASIDDPLAAHGVNVTGFIHMLDAARRAGVSRFIYAVSSAIYGNDATLPIHEDDIGRPLSPYAANKWMNEIYADVYQRSYGYAATGLRYFNIFGPRQDPKGAYAAVIPAWASAMIEGKKIQVNGDGENSRDFCYIMNVVQANIRAALAGDDAQGGICNIAVGAQTSLNQLASALREGLRAHQIHVQPDAEYGAARAGDVLHSVADISRAKQVFSYSPTHQLCDGIQDALPWYIAFFTR